MKKGNVLVIGNSGVGKSTLINAVIGEDVAATGWGTSGTTKALEIYEDEDVPFRVIDTKGFEPSRKKARQTVKEVRKWSKEQAKDKDSNNDINVIWFCVDGTSKKLFPETIEALLKATSLWKSVPIITVITKSYSVPERDENIEMVRQAFQKSKRAELVIDIIPVIAKTFTLNDDAWANPEGITELIEATLNTIPEGIKAAEKDVASFKLNRKRAIAHSITVSATAAGIATAALPIPIADTMILTPIEVAEIRALANVYEIPLKGKGKPFFDQLVEAGTIGIAAKAAISALKTIPVLNIGASLLNSIVAGSVIVSLGEVSIYAFEQVYLGNKQLELEWLKQLLEQAFTNSFAKKLNKVLVQMEEHADKKEITETIISIFKDLVKAIGK